MPTLKNSDVALNEAVGLGVESWDIVGRQSAVDLVGYLLDVVVELLDVLVVFGVNYFLLIGQQLLEMVNVLDVLGLKISHQAIELAVEVWNTSHLLFIMNNLPFLLLESLLFLKQILENLSMV